MEYYVYVLRSKKDKGFYVGYTTSLKDRLDLHDRGQVSSTKNRRPIELVYYEVSLNQEDALHREKYLKTTYGKRYIRNRLKNSIEKHQD